MKWRSIETAPKNKNILICEGEKMYVAIFNKFNRWEVDCTCIYAEDASEILPEYWMPLPKLPKKVNENE